MQIPSKHRMQAKLSRSICVQAIDNEQMQAEGRQKRANAEAKNEISEQKQNAKGQAQSAKGNVKEGVGKVIGNEQMVRASV